MSYKIKVPVTTYHETALSPEHIVALMEQEMKNVIGYSWDTIMKKSDGKYVYYNHGYGSHDVGRKEGPEVDEKIVETYRLLANARNYFRSKIQ